MIKGSATNQDGASNGLTAPNGPSQERVIRQALANAGLKPAEVDAVEAHGTGTALGDPIEAQALLATYGQERDNGPLALGSLKSNIGHTQAAAGVGGVIKMVMALREEALPKTLHVAEPTPHVDWSAGEIELLTEQRRWSRGERPRRAGVSSFGISGTNAHLILEEAPAQPAPLKDESKRPPLLPWALSAKSPEALAQAAGRLAAHVERQGPDPLDVAHTLLGARAQLAQRAVVIGADQAELLAGLDALARGKGAPNLVGARAAAAPKLAFCFPGQGSQWLGMAQELLADSPLFGEWIAKCEAALEPHLDFAIGDVLRAAPGAPSIERIEVVQPALFAVMVSLAELWRSHGVGAAAVIGHSQGEIAAAVHSGALTLAEGAKLAARRSALISKLTGKGAMVSCALSPERAKEKIAPYGSEVSLAAINSPTAVTLACSAGALAKLLSAFASEGIRAREVAATIPSHSHHVEPLREEVLESFADLDPQPAQIPFYSTLSGEPIDTTTLDAEYWYRNLREPVAFHQASQRLLKDGFGAFIEISPHPVLAMALQESAEAEDKPETAILHTLRRDEGGMRRLLGSLAQAHAHGIAVEWAPLFKESGATTVSLPTYPFQRQRYWLQGAAGAGDLSAAGQSSAEHPLLGAAIALSGEGSHLLTGRISAQSHPWLIDHAVAGTALMPGTGFLELALRAGQEVGANHLAELILEAPLLLPQSGAVQLQVAIKATEGSEDFELSIHSRPQAGQEEDGQEEEAPWTRHASATLSSQEPTAPAFEASEWPPAGAEPLESESFYERVGAIGLDYGPAFQGLEAAWRRGEEIYAEISLAQEQVGEAERFGIHPALLDAALHPGFFDADPRSQGRAPALQLRRRSPAEGRGASALRVRLSADGRDPPLHATDQDGVAVATIEALSLREVDPAQLGSAAVQHRRSLCSVGGAGVDRGRQRGVRDRAPRVQRAGESRDLRVPPRTQAPIRSRPPTPSAPKCSSACRPISPRRPGRLAPGLPHQGCDGAGPDEAPDPAAAAAWGLIRSAQSEHPGRFTVIDTDASAASKQALAAALRVTEEPQLALREGLPWGHALSKGRAAGDLKAPEFDPEATVLITGGLSGLGALTARHLAIQHGAKQLLLSSRRGPESPGATELIAELAELGCEAKAVACDVSDREQVKALLAPSPPSIR